MKSGEIKFIKLNNEMRKMVDIWIYYMRKSNHAFNKNNKQEYHKYNELTCKQEMAIREKLQLDIPQYYIAPHKDSDKLIIEKSIF